MGLFVWLMKKIAPVPKLTNYDNYVFVGPHPDDIEIGAGATAAKLVKMGKKVTFIIATDGRYGSEDADTDREGLVKTRQEEQRRAAEILGVKDIIFLPFSDGGAYQTEELSKELALLFGELKPDVVFCPDYQLINECHPDHVKTGRAASYAFISCMSAPLMKDLGSKSCSPKAIAYYYTDKPNSYVCVKDTHAQRIKALHEYKSQFPIENDTQRIFFGICLYLNLRTIKYGLKRLCGRAEAFRALSAMHTHCAPEAAKIK
jgi:LmbE family N-acetylglucosaminyl deacetylase